MKWHGTLVAAALLLACDKSQQDTSTPDGAAAANQSTPESVSKCVDRISTWIEIPNKPPEERDTEWQSINKECGDLYAQCGGVETTVAFVRGGNRGLVLNLAEGCTSAYCADFSEPKPKLCAGAKEMMTAQDTDAMAAASLEFHKAMLAADLGGAGSWDPVAERLATLWTGYGVVEMGGLGEAASLGFEVKVTPEGFVLETSGPHKWIKGNESTSTKLELLPAKGKKTDAPPDVARWDYAALAAEAKALKKANPEDAAVTLVVDEKVPSEVQTRTMNALRGEGCELEASDSPAKVPPECLFWRQTLE